MDKSIIIIGAGIYGLPAGCYGQMNGYDTRIFEQHTLPGGVCTSWKRKGYVFENCIHWLIGSGPGRFFNSFWEELGALQGKEIINHEEMFRVEDGDKTLILYSDLDKFKAHLKEISPQDSPFIEEMISDARKWAAADFPIDKATEVMTPLELIKLGWSMRSTMKIMKKYDSISCPELANRFKNPFLKKAFPLLLGTPPIYYSTAIITTLGCLDIGNAGFPKGGSLEFAKGIEKRYLNLGGKIDYRSRVEKIIVKDDRAVGVKLGDGSEHYADYVISAADGYSTIFDMLDGKYADEKIRGYYENLTLTPPIVTVSIGVDLDLSNEPHWLLYYLDEQISITDRKRDWIMVHNYSFDLTLAPAGKTMLNCTFETSFDYWNDLLKDKKEYKVEKEKIANTVISELDKRFPGFKSKVEITDVATPTTWVRYTGNWKGAYQGWAFTPKNAAIRMKKTLPGLKNFYISGQWVSPGGGLPPGPMLGRHVIQIICKKDKRKFVTSKP